MGTAHQTNVKSTLEIKQATFSDGGNYMVTAENSSGKTSSSASLAVEGETCVITAKVSGDPQPEVNWTKGKWREIKNYGRFNAAYDPETQQHSLTIVELDNPDTGAYRCNAKNIHGSTSAPFDLTVDGSLELEKIDPTVLKKPDPKTPEEDDLAAIKELLMELDPKEYERYAQLYGVTDYRQLLSRYEELIKEEPQEEIKEERVAELKQ